MNAVTGTDVIQADSHSNNKSFARIISYTIVAVILYYICSRYFVFWQGWPSLLESFQALVGSEVELEESQQYKGFGLILIFLGFVAAALFFAKRNNKLELSDDASRFKRWSYFVIRAAFWAVFLVGTVDATISFLRVEGLLTALVGQDLSDTLGLATKRGLLVHYPLMVLALIIASFTRSLGFIWLTFLVVLAEFTIVITRFIFSYEQAYMGDLVRFWYAALFLFASAYTLMEGGHVRVDVLYARMGNRSKAWVNALGSLFLGLTVCWTILHYGVGTPQSSLIAPILSFEVSQSGYGMYIKYLMGGFLIVYAVSMALAFVSIFLSSCAYLLNEPNAELPSGGEH